MKKILFSTLALGMLLYGSMAQATPIVTDGIFNASEWTNYAEEDTLPGFNHVGPGYGGQAYDVEYLGLYVDSSRVYFGIQAGFDFFGNSTHPAGDFALDFGNNNKYEYAIDFSLGGTNGVTYNLRSIDETTPNIAWNATPGSGSGWKDVRYNAHMIATPWKSYGGTIVSNPNFTGSYGSSYDSVSGQHYILEGSFDLSVVNYSGGPIALHWTMECGNDVLDVTTSPVPEPATMFLFGTGLAGIAGICRRKGKKA